MTDCLYTFGTGCYNPMHIELSILPKQTMMNNYRFLKSKLLLLLIFLSNITLAQSLDGLTLINAATDTEIASITEGSVFKIEETGNQLNIRANTTGTIGSVKFVLNGTPKNTEGAAPYAMVGDVSGDYKIWTPSIGQQTIKVTAYTEANAGGSVIGALEYNFSFSETVVPIESPSEIGTGAVTMSGELKQWHKITLDFDGPTHSETDNSPNPFMDYRLDVTFSKGDKTFVVPGYFAADGNAAESSASSGNVWRVHFAPNETGTWNYSASFRIGRDLAVSDDATAGEAVTSIDGKTGTFEVLASDKVAPDFRAKGRLKYVDKHHLQFEGTGEYFIKGGADAPENFLAYDGFDGVFKTDGHKDNLVKNWQPHVQDWNEGDPTWQSGKGKGIIGAVNYLADQGLNVFSFLTMNINGDDRNVYPYVSYSDYKHFDCSKLDQWEIVFTHGQKRGMYLHFKTQETENDQLLDGGNVGKTRKLYYRELIARYAHHLVFNWNLGEENTQTVQQRKDMAAYFASHDPYQNHIVIHSYPDQQDIVYPTLLGNASKLTGASIQTGWQKVYADTKRWIKSSADAGKPWVVANDEQGSANIGVPEDDFTGTPNIHQIRQKVLWGNFMAGGAGVEYYFGYQRPHSDLSAQDLRTRAKSWSYVSHALEFFRNHIPFQDMTAKDGLVKSGAWCLAKEGDTYLIYLPSGGTTHINLAGAAGLYEVSWFDPINGGAPQAGGTTLIAGEGTANIGTAPNANTQDWAVLVKKTDSVIDEPLPVIKTTSVSGTAPLEITFDATASQDNGSITSYSWDFGDNSDAVSGATATHTFTQSGTFTVTLTVTDNENKTATSSTIIKVEEEVVPGCEQQVWMSADLSFTNSAFYVDNYTGTPLLAIVPNEATGAPVSATIEKEFRGGSCDYDITFHGVGESDGQAEFKVYINNQQLGSTIVLPLSSQGWEMGAAFNRTFEGVTLNDHDIIKVEGKTASADGQEWSRARWLKLVITPEGQSSGGGEGGDASSCNDGAFEEKDGYLVVEAEDVELNDSWQIVNSFSEAALGEGHIEHKGANSYNTVKQNSILEYKIQINTPGVYQFKWRARNGKAAVKFDEENDSWLKIDADAFYGTKNGQTVDLHDHFVKIWIQSINEWSWNSQGEGHDASGKKVNGMGIFARFDNAGEYTVYIGGRSHNHPIDRFALYQSGKGGIAMNVDTPASRKGGCMEDKSAWEVIYSSSENEAGNSGNALDADAQTYWITKHGTGPKPSLPHDLQIDMKERYEVSKVFYQSRQDNPVGTVGQYEIYISDDKMQWGEPVAEGTFDWGSDLQKNHKKLQIIELEESVKGRYLRLRALTEAHNNPSITTIAVAELGIGGQMTGDDPVLSVTDNYLENKVIGLYPNPVQNSFKIQNADNIEQVEIFSLVGNSVNPSLWNSKLNKVNVENLHSGIYIIQANINNEIQRFRFIKE